MTVRVWPWSRGVPKLDHLAQIDALSAANRRRRRTRIEQRLIQLRVAALPELDSSPSTERSVPIETHALPTPQGPPEVRADDLTLEKLRSGISEHGCLLVRGLVDRSTVESLVDDVNRAFAGYQRHVGGNPARATAPWYVPFPPVPDNERRWCHEGGGILTVESPRSLFDVVETFDACGIGPLVASFLGGRPALLAKKWHLRRVPAGIIADWHQDGAFMGRNIRTMNVWLALSACGQGRDAPGLDIVARRFDDIVDTGTDGAHMDWSVGHGMAERVADGRIVTPTFEAGDALLFDHLLLHRTEQRPRGGQDRYAIEAWFAAAASYPAAQVPIAY